MNGTTGHFVAYPGLGTRESAETLKRPSYWQNPALQRIADARRAGNPADARRIYDELFQNREGS